MLNKNLSIPVKETVISINKLKSKKLIYKNKPLFDKIDEYIKKGKDYIFYDERINQIVYNNYINELYFIFKLELSNFLSDSNNSNIRNKLIKILESESNNKVVEINKYLLKVIDKRILSIFEKNINKNYKQSGGKYNKFVHIISKDARYK